MFEKTWDWEMLKFSKFPTFWHGTDKCSTIQKVNMRVWYYPNDSFPRFILTNTSSSKNKPC